MDNQNYGYSKFLVLISRALIMRIFVQTGDMKNHGSLEDFRLVLHGTAEAPHHMKAGPRAYDENYNTVQNERSVSYR